MISRTRTSSGLSSLVGFLRPTSHGGRAVASASVRSLRLARNGREEGCAASALVIITSVDGRITDSTLLHHHQGGRPESRGHIGECGLG